MTFVFAAAFLLAGPPRFLGPPEKKPAEGEPPAVSAGEPAPLFSGSVQNPDAAGVQAVDLGALLGPGGRPTTRAVLISFFSSACEACSKELPVLQTLATTYAERGLRVISVAVDRDQSAAQRTALLLRDSGVTFPVVDDRDRRIARQYLGSTLRLPSLFIVDGEGKVVVAKKGYADDPATFLPAQVAAALR
ncbi:MAG TPA: TlpA disulfide reductase family protein [Myxococcales bacterium]|nr:TlpA disulfide reductase family protein [Myxococcales bacterium]